MAPLDHFLANLSRCRALCDVANGLTAIVSAAIDLSDLYRASIVLGVSALDNFIHEFVRQGMREVNSGARPMTDGHLTFKIPMSAARAALASYPSDDWLDAAVRESHSWLSFQHPDKIAEAIRLISAKRLWESVASELGATTPAVRAQLSTIVDRRNKIAHEADIDPTNPGHRWPIDEKLTRDALDYLEKIVRAIHNVAS